MAARHGLVITELSTHLQGQLVAVHPAYDEAFDAFAPAAVKGRPNERQAWAVNQVVKVAQTSRRLGLTGSVSFTGALAWPFLYPWPHGAREGAAFIRDHIIRVTDRAFDDFAGGTVDAAQTRRMLGLDPAAS